MFMLSVRWPTVIVCGKIGSNYPYLAATFWMGKCGMVLERSCWNSTGSYQYSNTEGFKFGPVAGQSSVVIALFLGTDQTPDAPAWPPHPLFWDDCGELCSTNAFWNLLVTMDSTATSLPHKNTECLINCQLYIYKWICFTVISQIKRFTGVSQSSAHLENRFSHL